MDNDEPNREAFAADERQIEQQERTLERKAHHLEQEKD